MQFFNKKFGLIILFVVFSAFFIQQIFSQEEGFGVFDISFHTGINSPFIDHLSATVDISGANFTGFRVKVENTSTKNINLKLNFGNQIQTNDSENIKSCDIARENFRSNMIYDTGSFVLPAGSGIYKYIQLDFSSCSSGGNLGCIAVQEANTTGMGIFDINLSRIGFVDFFVISDIINCNTVYVKAFQENRNIFPSAQKVLPNQRTIGILGFYNMNGTFITTGSINLGRGGTGKTNINTSLSGHYIVTFQGLSSIKSMISGILLNEDNKIIDFTTGNNIFGSTTEDRNEDGLSDDGYLYLKVGEIKPYDGEINGDDIAKLLPEINKTNKTYGLNEYDMDGDGGITIADIGIIVYNLHKRSIGYEYSESGLLPRMIP